MAQVKSVSDWARAQLHDLGIPPSKGAMQVLVGWAKAEGGNWNNSAKYNPLNTTQPMPGASTFRSVGQGAADIGIYKDWQQGIKATTRTLRNGRYDHIIKALRNGDVDGAISAIGNSPWGTGGGLVANSIRGTSGNLPTAPLAVTDPSADPSAGGAPGPLFDTTKTSRRLVSPAVNNEAARAALVYNFLSPSSHDKKDLLGFAAQAQGLKDVPAQYATDTTTTRTPKPASVAQSADSAASGVSLPKGKSPLFEVIHKTDSGPGYAVKDGKVVSGPGVYSSVWNGHADHVHVAAGPQTIVQLGKLAEKMGLHVGENPHFGGVTAVHVPGSYHYKGEAIDVSAPMTPAGKRLMDRYAAAVERAYKLKR